MRLYLAIVPALPSVSAAKSAAAAVSALTATWFGFMLRFRCLPPSASPPAASPRSAKLARCVTSASRGRVVLSRSRCFRRRSASLVMVHRASADLCIAGVAAPTAVSGQTSVVSCQPKAVSGQTNVASCRAVRVQMHDRGCGCADKHDALAVATPRSCSSRRIPSAVEPVTCEVLGRSVAHNLCSPSQRRHWHHTARKRWAVGSTALVCRCKRARGRTESE